MEKQRKIIGFLVLFLSFLNALNAQTVVTYATNPSPIFNPEKGFYHNIPTGLVTSTYPLLSKTTLTNYRTTEKISVIQRIFYLNQFISVPISNSYLLNIQTDLNTIRSAGLKVIIRFAYSKSSTATPIDATKAIILQHVAQVGTILTANKDIIVSYQYGWIGAWGETYYSSQVSEFGSKDYTKYTTTQWNNRRQVLDAMLASVPSDIPVQVRYVYHKQKMCPLGNNRVGFYNDAFLNQWGDSGTFLVSGALGIPSTTDKNYFISTSLTVPITGETDGVNSPRTDCTNAQYETNLYNWSLLNKDYLVTNITNWQTNGCYTNIQKSLGYDFRLNNSNITNGILTINIGNYGYANLFKDRKAYLVCKNTSTNINYSFLIDTNFKNCVSSSYNITANLTTLGLSTGSYKLYLNLPDSLNGSINYSIQTSNLNTWTIEGFNDLQCIYTVSTIARKVFEEEEKVISTVYYDLYGHIIEGLIDNQVFIKVTTTNKNIIVKKVIYNR